MALDPSDFPSDISDFEMDESPPSPPVEFQQSAEGEGSTDDSVDLGSQVPRWCQQPSGPCDSDAEIDQSDTLRSLKILVEQVNHKVDRNEKMLKELLNSESDSSGCSRKGSSKSKRKISSSLRQEVRKIYKGLCENEDIEDFDGWSILPGKTINSPENVTIMDRLIKEVKKLNPHFSTADIRASAYRYYQSLCETESSKRRGKDEALKVAKRRHERLLRKKKERESVIQKNSKLTTDTKEKWMKVMRNEVMSSEESDTEANNNIVKPLPWRSDYVNQMFHKIDDFLTKQKSPQARRQTKSRVVGEPSTRKKPADLPAWAISNVL